MGSPAASQQALAAIAVTGSRDGPLAVAPPTLMTLAMFFRYAAPREIAQIRSVIPDDMDIGAESADQLKGIALGIAGVPMIFLDQKIMGGAGIGGAAILRMEIAPAGSLQNQANLGLDEIEDHQSPRRVGRPSIAQIGGDGQAQAIGGNGGNGIDLAGSIRSARKRGIDG